MYSMASCTMSVDMLRKKVVNPLGYPQLMKPMYSRASCTMSVDVLRKKVVNPFGYPQLMKLRRERDRTPPPYFFRHDSVDVAQRELVSNKQ